MLTKAQSFCSKPDSSNFSTNTIYKVPLAAIITVVMLQCHKSAHYIVFKARHTKRYIVTTTMMFTGYAVISNNSSTNCFAIVLKPRGHTLHKNATTHQVTTMLATSKNILFPGPNHLLTTGTDDPSHLLPSRRWK